MIFLGKTKTDQILAFMQKNGSITSQQAFHHFNATRLASIIYNLRNQGHIIKTQPTCFKSSQGQVRSYATYLYLGKEKSL